MEVNLIPKEERLCFPGVEIGLILMLLVALTSSFFYIGGERERTEVLSQELMGLQQAKAQIPIEDIREIEQLSHEISEYQEFLLQIENGMEPYYIRSVINYAGQGIKLLEIDYSSNKPLVLRVLFSDLNIGAEYVGKLLADHRIQNVHVDSIEKMYEQSYLASIMVYPKK
ncbi:hypothetical protein GGQ84_001932 [Desulfitispora alkaliphila]|uniref:hypothetical protein n=1 Tax=Desulfitispora alkaliphila TaxID=622674 RepID=UPI003D1C8CF3